MSGFGTVMPGGKVIVANGGIWNKGANAVGGHMSNVVCSLNP